MTAHRAYLPDWLRLVKSFWPATAIALLLAPVSDGAPGLATIGPAVALEAQTATRPEVVALRFEGNEVFSDRSLANAIVTRNTACSSFVVAPFCWAGREFALERAFLNPRILREDFVRIHLFYRQRGFREVSVDTLVTRGENESTAEVTFLIEEGAPHRITQLEVRGLENLDDPSIVANLPVEVGDPLNMLVLDAARDTLSQRLQNRGYAHADVLRSLFLPAGTLEAELEFDVYTGPRARFGPIHVVGNEDVEEHVILRMLPFQEGSVYSQELLFEAQRNVYNLEIFRHAAIAQDLDHQPDSLVPLQVQVNEGDSHRVRSGGGWNTAECFTSEARWSSRNYFGGARRLMLRGRVSNLFAHSLEDSICSGAGADVYGDIDWVVSADFTQPWVFSPRNAFQASIYAERQSLQDVFVRRAVGVNLNLIRTLGRGTNVTLSYRPQLSSLDAAEVFFCTSFLVCDPLEIDLLQASNRISPVGAAFARDRTNRAISPTGGYTFRIDLEHASSITRSDFDYQRAVVEASSYFGFLDELVLAGRLRAGWLRPGVFQGLRALDGGADLRIAHPQTRFYAGGSNSNRGYAQNQLGPKVVSIQLEDLVFATGGRQEAVCTPEEVQAFTCDASMLAEDRFFARPTGGSRLLEANLELRFPVWDPLLGGVAFVDVGRVWETTGPVRFDDLAITPGLGLRYTTPIGPVRVDVGYRGRERAQLPVVTSQLRPFDPLSDPADIRLRGPDGSVLDWVRIDDLALLEPTVTFDDATREWWRRLQLHFSIGQAF